MTKLLFIAVAALIGHCLAFAQNAPAGLTFQGRLTTLSGQPVPNGTAKVRVRIFDAPTGGTRLWTSGEGPGQELTVPVRNGVFSTVLSQGFNSSNQALTIGPTVFQGGVIYVEIQPLNQNPIVPRTQIWSAPWAFLAETVGDGSITTAKLADFRSTEPINPGVTTAKLGDGAVTAPKIADGSVTSMKLADGAVENQKLADNSVTAIKISTGAVSTIKMADGCVESAKLANDVGSMFKVSGGMIHFGPWIDQAGTPAFQVNQNLVIKKYNVLLSEGPNVPGGGIGDGTPNAYFFMNADVSSGTYFYQWTNKFIIQSERGPVQINSLVVTGSKSFEIDLPSDPKNKTLTHYCVEAPEAINVYTGTIRTGADGYAEVSLPAYFESLNTDPHYQLTTIGIFSQAIVAKKILGNKFTIQTEKPDVEVSWQVTATRNDRAYNYYKRPNVRLKEQGEKGTYLVPEAYGEPPRFSKAKWRQSK